MYTMILARDTGMRNRRELYQMRIENLDWKNRTIFVPDSKTPDGRRVVPMSDRVYELLRSGVGKKARGIGLRIQARKMRSPHRHGTPVPASSRKGGSAG